MTQTPYPISDMAPDELRRELRNAYRTTAAMRWKIETMNELRVEQQAEIDRLRMENEQLRRKWAKETTR